MSSLLPPNAQPYALLKGKTHCKQTSVCEREYKGMHLREKKKRNRESVSPQRHAMLCNLMYCIGNGNFMHSNRTRSDKKVSKKKRGSGNGVHEMTSTNRRDNSAFRQTDVRDGEVEKSLTSSSEERCTVMCGFYTRATLDHTERERKKMLLPACPRFRTAHLLPITLPPSSAITPCGKTCFFVWLCLLIHSWCF